MNEQELRDGLREVMVASSQPPSMNPNAALDAAKRAQKRRRATWAGAGAGAAVVALAVGTVFALSPSGESLPIGVAAGGPTPPAISSRGGLVDPSGAAGSTKPSWPDGQTDRTARQGPRVDTANGLLDALKAAMPSTLTVDPTAIYFSGDRITGTQANFEDYAGPEKKEVWQYLATAAVKLTATPGAGTGRVLVGVYTPGNQYPADICQATPQYWGAGGACAPRTVQGKTVGVVQKPEDPRLDTVVGFRHDDGTVVFVAQSKAPDNTGAVNGGAAVAGSLPQPPLTVEQLAQMVLNPAFKVR